jgi:hypothetical protein
MSRAEKAERLLRTLEDELRTRLRHDLPRVAAGDDSLYFFNAQFKPDALPVQRLSARGCEAFGVASRILSLRQELGVFDQSAAETFTEAVVKHAGADPHRLGAQRLAGQLLADLEEIWRNGGIVGRPT